LCKEREEIRADANMISAKSSADPRETEAGWFSHGLPCSAGLSHPALTFIAYGFLKNGNDLEQGRSSQPGTVQRGYKLRDLCSDLFNSWEIIPSFLKENLAVYPRAHSLF
jgi:hypothetical protein